MCISLGVMSFRMVSNYRLACECGHLGYNAARTVVPHACAHTTLRSPMHFSRMQGLLMFSPRLIRPCYVGPAPSSDNYQAVALFKQQTEVQVLPVFFWFAQLVCLWFTLSALSLFLPYQRYCWTRVLQRRMVTAAQRQERKAVRSWLWLTRAACMLLICGECSGVASVTGHVIYVGHGFMDNFLIALAYQPSYVGGSHARKCLPRQHDVCTHRDVVTHASPRAWCVCVCVCVHPSQYLVCVRLQCGCVQRAPCCRHCIGGVPRQSHCPCGVRAT